MTRPLLLKEIILDGKTCDILIENGLISSIRPAGTLTPQTTDYEVLDCTGKVAVPPFVNAHTHAAMTLLRGYGEDMPLHKWLPTIWELESHIDEDFIYWGTKLACLEMIKTGTSTFNDQYWIQNIARKASEELGTRSVIGYVLLDNGDAGKVALQKEECQALYEDSLSWSSMSRMSVCTHSIYTVSEDLILWGSDFARKHSLQNHIHLCETLKEVEDCKAAHGGLTPVEYLDRLGVLGPEVVAAHSLWLTDNDIEILARNKVNCVHNINSNAKLSSGFKFKYNEMRDAGINICIGTDGCASSNNLDMLEALKTSALFQKAWREDPEAMPLNELLELGTINGAKALGINTGRIAEGMLADIAIVNTNSTFFASAGSFEANLVYSAHSDCIETMIIEGRIVMKDRKVEGEDEIIREAAESIKKITKK